MNRKALSCLTSMVVIFAMTGCRHNQQASTQSSNTTAPSPARATAPAVMSGHVNSLANHHIGPDALYPDPDRTPGEADTLSLDDLNARYTEGCPSGKSDCTYSQSHRKVSKSVHTQVYDEYNVAEEERNIQGGEVDHFYPLCAGGSNDIKNLWYQPAENKWKGKNFGYHEKDTLESWVCIQIKAGKVDPKVAFTRITTDWVAYYLENKLDKDIDGEDEDID